MRFGTFGIQPTTARLFCPSEPRHFPLTANRNQIGTEFRHEAMPQISDRQDLCYARLHAAYRSEWQALAQKTRCWRLLEDAEQSVPGNIRQAKSLADAAEDRYRRARNELWEYILMHSSPKSLASPTLSQPWLDLLKLRTELA